MIRPGPAHIGAGALPRGVVIHVYSATIPPTLILVRFYTNDMSLAAAAEVDSYLCEAMGYSDVCLVAYDGDTGARFTADEWMRG